jgi:hypothetical protein
MERNTGQLNKHGIMFGVSVSRSVGSVVAPRRAGAQGSGSIPAAHCGGGAIKHNVSSI